jgi:hypothetical protein
VDGLGKVRPNPPGVKRRETIGGLWRKPYLRH